MKKLLALLLVVIQVFALCACKESNNTEKESNNTEGNVTAMNTNAENSLRVGYARENVTPNYSIPLAGYGNTLQRMSNGFVSYLYTTCIAITDSDDSTVLLFTSDLIVCFPFGSTHDRSEGGK